MKVNFKYKNYKNVLIKKLNHVKNNIGKANGKYQIELNKFGWLFPNETTPVGELYKRYQKFESFEHRISWFINHAPLNVNTGCEYESNVLSLLNEIYNFINKDPNFDKLFKDWLHKNIYKIYNYKCNPSSCLSNEVFETKRQKEINDLRKIISRCMLNVTQEDIKNDFESCIAPIIFALSVKYPKIMRNGINEIKHIMLNHNRDIREKKYDLLAKDFYEKFIETSY